MLAHICQKYKTTLQHGFVYVTVVPPGPETSWCIKEAVYVDIHQYLDD